MRHLLARLRAPNLLRHLPPSFSQAFRAPSVSILTPVPVSYTFANMAFNVNMPGLICCVAVPYFFHEGNGTLMRPAVPQPEEFIADAEHPSCLHAQYAGVYSLLLQPLDTGTPLLWAAPRPEATGPS